jgi:biopolymer transport protein ExbD
MRFDGRRQTRRAPGLTPLIDVVFLLLIFFMLVTRFEHETRLPLQLSVVSEDAERALDANRTPTALAEEVGDAVVVRLDSAGDTWLAGDRVADGLLAIRLEAALGRRSTRQGGKVRVESDATVSVQRIVTALRGVAGAGADSVSLAGSP